MKTFDMISMILEPHSIIGWDIDNTLLYGHSGNSKFFQAYVVAHPEKTHHLMTFRTGVLVTNIVRDMARYKEVDGCSHNLFSQLFTMLEEGFRNTLYNIADKETFDNCYGFKAKACRKTGATILVDDMILQQKKYCMEENVALLDSISLELFTPVPPCEKTILKPTILRH